MQQSPQKLAPPQQQNLNSQNLQKQQAGGMQGVNNGGEAPGTSSTVGPGGVPHGFKKPGLSAAQQEVIVIHVFDENRKVNKDFTCEKELLVTHMKYFEKYLTEATSVDDIDISVHCDIKIFEWLMKYLK
jgi:hypothetical protein